MSFSTHPLQRSSRGVFDETHGMLHHPSKRPTCLRLNLSDAIGFLFSGSTLLQAMKYTVQQAK